MPGSSPSEAPVTPRRRLPTWARWVIGSVAVAVIALVIVGIVAASALRGVFGPGRPDWFAGYTTAPGSHILSLVFEMCPGDTFDDAPIVTGDDDSVDVWVQLWDWGGAEYCDEPDFVVFPAVLDAPVGDRTVMWSDDPLTPYDGPMPDLDGALVGYEATPNVGLTVTIEACGVDSWRNYGAWEGPDRVEVAIQVWGWEESCDTPGRTTIGVLLRDGPLGDRVVYGPAGTEIPKLGEP